MVQELVITTVITVIFVRRLSKLNKYRGKYKKCRKCTHVEYVGMMLVEVKNTCPKGLNLNGGLIVAKDMCEECEYFEAKQSVSSKKGEKHEGD